MLPYKYVLFSEANADVVVQAGVSWNVLNDTLKEKGKHISRHIGLITKKYPMYRHSFIFSCMCRVGTCHWKLPLMSFQLDPGLGATIGGVISTGCSGSMPNVFSVSLSSTRYLTISSKCDAIRHCAGRMDTEHGEWSSLNSYCAPCLIRILSRRLSSSHLAKSSRLDSVPENPLQALTSVNCLLARKAR